MSAKRKVLIIEDEHALQHVLSDRLEEEGFVVAEALDGEEGLHKLEEFNPDLVILDMIMPRMDGLTVLAEIRKQEKIIPVYVLTNLADEPNLNKIQDQLKEGDKCVVKTDIPLSEVVDEVKALIEQKRS